MKNNFIEDELIIYQNGDKFEIGKIKRLTEDGAFIYYHSGDTASKTPFDCMHKLVNAYCIPWTTLGGTTQWIPFKNRRLTEEEKEEMNTDFDYMLDCKLPDDDQTILVCYKNGYVEMDTFFNDCGECYLDSGSAFIDDVIAWMPLPEPYKEV